MHCALRHMRTLLTLSVVLGGTACSGRIGEEPQYVLRDSLGRSVAMAGRSQLGNAAPGTTVRASFGGTEQNLMVGERIGMGPIFQPGALAAAEPSGMASTTQGAPAVLASTSVTPDETRTRARGTRSSSASSGRPVSAAASETGANPSGRRRGPPPRSISRSVM